VTRDGVAVRCEPSDDGWSCVVRVGDDATATEHVVSVGRRDLERLAPGRSAAELVEASFAFLLEREPRESILRRFDLPVIGHYFGDYEDEITRRLRD
jgi:hypothetical protein